MESSKLKPIIYKDLKIGGNILAAPLAGYTNYPSRIIFQQYGADMTFTEMVSSRGIVYNDKKTLDLLYTDKKEVSKSIQLFGDDPKILKDAIEYVRDNTEFKIVNLNAGCPVKKILKSKSGGFLLKNLSQLKKILKEVGNIKNIFLTIKIRSGWDKDSLNYLYVSKLVEDYNFKMIIFHPRTVRQLFKDFANWELVYDLKEKIELPVIGNGDILSPEDAFKKIRNLDGIMIGRSMLGAPWIFRNIKEFFINNKYPEVSVKEKINIMLKHLQGMIDFFGEQKGILLFRGYLFKYIKNFKNSKLLRQRLQTLSSFQDIKKVLNKFDLI